MKRIAFFVEGLTEQLFLIKFIEEAYAKSRIAIASIKGSGGNKTGISFTTITAASITAQTSYYILIVDCGGDANIKSYILDQRLSLISAAYSKIIGLRDVYPIARADIHKLTTGLYFQLPQTSVRIDFILSTMEVEAWFLSEHTHFNRIDSKLSPSVIHANLAFSPETDDMELRDTPAEDLHNSYRIVGKAYKKDNFYIQRTVNAIDYTELYFNTKPPSLIQLKTELDSFFI